MGSELPRLSLPSVQHQHRILTNRRPGFDPMGKGHDDAPVAYLANGRRSTRGEGGKYSVDKELIADVRSVYGLDNVFLLRI